MMEFTLKNGQINAISPPAIKAPSIPPPVSTSCDTCTSATPASLSQISIPGTSITFSLNDTLLIMAFIIALIDLAIGLKR